MKTLTVISPVYQEEEVIADFYENNNKKSIFLFITCVFVGCKSTQFYKKK